MEGNEIKQKKIAAIIKRIIFFSKYLMIRGTRSTFVLCFGLIQSIGAKSSLSYKSMPASSHVYELLVRLFLYVLLHFNKISVCLYWNNTSTFSIYTKC
jgi:hypothetical protein